MIESHKSNSVNNNESPAESDPNMEQDFEVLRKRFALDNNKAANRLRARCFDYAAPEQDASD